MGVTNSKSPLERRNTVARRSQRRTLHNLKSKVDNLHKDIKKFKGTTEDTNYVKLKNEIEYFKNDLSRRKKDLQPQVRALYETVYKRLSEADEALINKLQENREKQEKKDAKEIVSSVGDDISEDPPQSEVDNETVVDVHHQETEENKRKTVEINLVKVIPEDDTESTTTSPKEVRIISPAEKRKSILKVGVAVLPGAVMSEFTSHTNKITQHYNGIATPSSPVAPRTVQEVTARINTIIDQLRQVEQDISDFVGQKNGKQYNKIRDLLNQYLVELSTISPVDDVALEQLVVCRNYIGSCLSFLDEKASAVVSRESFTSDDEVFDNNNVTPALAKVEENFRLQKLLKNTAV